MRRSDALKRHPEELKATKDPASNDDLRSVPDPSVAFSSIRMTFPGSRYNAAPRRTTFMRIGIAVLVAAVWAVGVAAAEDPNAGVLPVGKDGKALNLDF